MSDDRGNAENHGLLVAIGSILGVGIGAAVGWAVGDWVTGLWIGAIIGVGLGMLAMYIQMNR